MCSVPVLLAWPGGPIERRLVHGDRNLSHGCRVRDDLVVLGECASGEEQTIRVLSGRSYQLWTPRSDPNWHVARWRRVRRHVITDGVNATENVAAQSG